MLVRNFIKFIFISIISLLGLLFLNEILPSSTTTKMNGKQGGPLRHSYDFIHHYNLTYGHIKDIKSQMNMLDSASRSIREEIKDLLTSFHSDKSEFSVRDEQFETELHILKNNSLAIDAELDASKEDMEKLLRNVQLLNDSARTFQRDILHQLHMLRHKLHELSTKSSSTISTTSSKITAGTGSSSTGAGFRVPEPERRGILKCNGREVDSEVIYWKIVPGDAEYKSPISPHANLEHANKFLSFRHDPAGFNNMRMTFESLVVTAHAMGRTLVLPPYLDHIDLNRVDISGDPSHKDMGFEELISLDVLRTQKGFYSISMADFLAQQGNTGRLKGILPPRVQSGEPLNDYLTQAADVTPQWFIKFLVFPRKTDDFTLTEALKDPHTRDRLYAFYGHEENGRAPIYYNKTLQEAKLIHIISSRTDFSTRILQHPYAFVFFADPEVSSFYKRFVRNYLRYNDFVHCAGDELVRAIRNESLFLNPANNGEYYALHIRRSDIHVPTVKLNATQIVKNLHFPDGTPIIPRGAYVYIATDDPNGVCNGCLDKNGRPCPSLHTSHHFNIHNNNNNNNNNSRSTTKSLPKGCIQDPSWTAFIEAGWTIRFLRDFTKQGLLRGVNIHAIPMTEVITCSRAKRFAGTFYSTFTGYIHRLRGYHGLGEESYLHAPNGATMDLRREQSVGSGWMREWRTGWTDDRGGLI